jgi:hypothetical protein
MRKLAALNSANVCTAPTVVLRDAKKLMALLQHAPLNREHLETAVRVHAITLTNAKKYGHAIKFLQLATQLAKEPKFKRLDRDAHIIKHLATPELAVRGQAKVLLEQASARAAGSDAAEVQVALDGPVIKFAANLMVTGTQVLLPTADNEQWLGVALKSVEISPPGHAAYLFQGTPRPLTAWFHCPSSGLHVRRYVKYKACPSFWCFWERRFRK